MASVENPRFGKSQRREIEETIDSGECGERNSGKIMATTEKASRQVLEFKDTYGFYCGEKSVEDEDFKYVDLLDEYCESDEEEEIRNATFPREDVLKHLKQVRQSFGFDVDVDIPLWLGFRHYIPIDVSGGYDRDRAYEAAECAIHEINADIGSSDSDGLHSPPTSLEDSHASSFDGLDLLDSTVSYSASHPEVSMGLGKKRKYSVICVFASQFLQLRDQCCPSEVDFIASLCRCRNWDAKGGKCKSLFANKTLDDRLIIKEIL